MSKALLLCITLLVVRFSYSQNDGFSYQIEAGMLISVGPNHYRTDLVRLNNITEIFYADRLRFAKPSARIRFSMLYGFCKRIKAGVESGGSLRFGEEFYDYEILYSIPVQAKLTYHLISFENFIKIGLDGSAGYHFRNYYKIPVTERGGFIYSVGVMISRELDKHLNWFAKIGFEKQTENINRKIPAREPLQRDGYYDFKIYRNQVLISLGISLN